MEKNNSQKNYLKFPQFLLLGYLSIYIWHNICVSIFKYNFLMWVFVFLLATKEMNEKEHLKKTSFCLFKDLIVFIYIYLSDYDDPR